MKNKRNFKERVFFHDCPLAPIVSRDSRVLRDGREAKALFVHKTLSKYSPLLHVLGTNALLRGVARGGPGVPVTPPW